MPCLVGNYGPLGIIVQVPVFRDKHHVLQLSTIAQGSTPPSLSMYAALLDTGASATRISPKVISDLGLTPIGKANMISASHVIATNKYIFTIGFIFAAQQAAGSMQGQIFSFHDIAGLEFQPSGAVYGFNWDGYNREGGLDGQFCGTIYFLVLK